MPGLGRAVSVALLAFGLALTLGAVAAGQAHGTVIGFIPVLYGTSPALGAGVALFAFGGFGLWASAPEGGSGSRRSLPDSLGPVGAAERTTTGTRGFLLIGPLPIWCGEGHPPSDRTVVGVIVAALAAYVVLIALFFFL